MRREEHITWCSNACLSAMSGWCAAVSIVERDRQYHKSTGGTCARVATARSLSFCQYTFLPKLPTVLVVEDTLKDKRCASWTVRSWQLKAARCVSCSMPECCFSSQRAVASSLRSSAVRGVWGRSLSSQLMSRSCMTLPSVKGKEWAFQQPTGCWALLQWSVLRVVAGSRITLWWWPALIPSASTLALRSLHQMATAWVPCESLWTCLHQTCV